MFLVKNKYFEWMSNATDDPSFRSGQKQRKCDYDLKIGLAWWVFGMILAAGSFTFVLSFFCRKRFQRVRTSKATMG